MRNNFTVDQIKETATYRALLEKKETTKCNFLEQRTARSTMYHAYLVYKNTGIIPSTVLGMYLSVVKDFIALDNIEVDYSTVMTAESIKMIDDEK